MEGLEDLGITEEELAVDDLRDQGADLSARRRVAHLLYFPARMLADPAAEELRRLGFAVEISLDDETHEWVVTGTHELVVTVPELTRFRERMTALAGLHGGEYAGYDIEVHEVPREDDVPQWLRDADARWKDEPESD